MRGHTSRRRFLRHAAGTGLGLLVLKDSRSAWAAQANERLNIALIGVGGRGEWFVGCIPDLGENVVAICDVDDQRAAKAYERFPEVPRYADFRVMLDEMDDRIDAVVVATPDHTHAVISVTAMKRGKPVYCEKPLTNRLWESRVMRETARERGVATQMGNQGTAAGPFRRALELLRQGIIGDIREVLFWNDAGGPGRTQPPQGTEPIPETLHWDLWLGPAAERSYHPEWLQWHAWRDFGTGQLGNWAVHTSNLAFMALEVHSLWRADPAAGPPPKIRVEAQVAEINGLAFPTWEIVRYDLPARGQWPPVTFTWLNGSASPGGRQRIEDTIGRKLDWGDYGEKQWADYAGLLIVGSAGQLHATGHNATFTLLPEDQFQGYDGPPQTVPDSPGHEREWLNAIRGGEPAWSNFVDYGAALAEFVLLGNVATQFAQVLEYDPVAGQIADNLAANEALRRDYREGWSL